MQRHSAGDQGCRTPFQTGLRDLFRLVWNSEEIPGDWRTDIIFPLFKSKGSNMDCSNFRGITLLYVPGKVSHTYYCTHQPILHAKWHQEQSRFNPRRSTVNPIPILGILDQTGREYHPSLYAAYVDIEAAIDSPDSGVLSKIMSVLSLPPKIL